MKNVFLLSILSLTGLSALAGPVNGNTPYYCSEVKRELIQDKLLTIPNQNDSTANVPVEIKVQLFKSLISCAGSYGRGDIRSALSIEMTAKDTSLMKNSTYDLVGSQMSLSKSIEVIFDSTIINELKFQKWNYMGREESVKEIFNIKDSIFSIPVAGQYSSSYSTKVFSLDISNVQTQKNIYDFWNRISIEIKNFPKIEFINK